MSKLIDLAFDRRGSLVVVAGLALIPLAGIAGAALDYSRGAQVKTQIQTAADLAALAGIRAAVPTGELRAQTAMAAFQAQTAGLSVTPTVTATSSRVNVSASSSVPTVLIKLMRIDNMTVHAAASAAKLMEGPPPCILALNKTASPGIQFSGGSSFSAVGCAIHSNSAANGAVSATNNASLSAAGLCAVGTVNVPDALKSIAQPYCDPLPDPFANVASPPTGSCTATNRKVNPNQTVTLSPGTYCGGLTLQGAVTLNPGVYVIVGKLAINSQAAIRGEGVTFYLTGPDAEFSVNAGGILELSAPTTGDTKGILFFQDRFANPWATNTFNGGSETKVSGAFYTPTQTIRFTGSSALTQSASFMPIIADKVEMSGNFAGTASGMLLPAPLPKTESGVKLIN